MIKVKNVSFSSENRLILENINLDINNGDFVAVIGPNGAGKSTLIKIILNLISDYTGEIFIDNSSNKDFLKKQIIGYLPQRESFDKNFPAKAIDIALLGLAANRGLLRRFTQQDKKRADEVFSYLNITHLKNNFIGTLSGGEFQRVLIARALIANSNYLILDEPEAGVDSNSVVEFFNLLVNLNKLGKTIVLISHDINMVLKYCTHLVCLNKTLHSHTKAELATSEMIQKAYGEVMQIVEKHY